MIRRLKNPESLFSPTAISQTRLVSLTPTSKLLVLLLPQKLNPPLMNGEILKLSLTNLLLLKSLPMVVGEVLEVVMKRRLPLLVVVDSQEVVLPEILANLTIRTPRIIRIASLAIAAVVVLVDGEEVIEIIKLRKIILISHLIY